MVISILLQNMQFWYKKTLLSELLQVFEQFLWNVMLLSWVYTIHICCVYWISCYHGTHNCANCANRVWRPLSLTLRCATSYCRGPTRACAWSELMRAYIITLWQLIVIVAVVLQSQYNQWGVCFIEKRLQWRTLQYAINTWTRIMTDAQTQFIW